MMPSQNRPSRMLAVTVLLGLAAPRHALRTSVSLIRPSWTRRHALCMKAAWSAEFGQFIDDYEFPVDEYRPQAEPPKFSVRASRKRSSRKSSKRPAASREDMFAAMTKLDAFISGYDFPAAEAGAEAAAEAVAPVALPEGQALSQIEADADAVFAVLDVNGDGRLSMEELGRHLGAAGYSQAAVDNLFRTFCADSATIARAGLRDAFVRFATLRQAPGLIQSHSPEDESAASIATDAEALFNAIASTSSPAPHGSRLICRNELRAHLSETAYTDEAIGNIFDAIDANRDGHISLDELVGSLTRLSALRIALGLGRAYDYGAAAQPQPEYRYLW